MSAGIERLTSEAANVLSAAVLDCWNECEALTDSPIERLFLTSLRTMGLLRLDYCRVARSGEDEMILRERRVPVIVRPQHTIEKYRVDFFILFRNGDAYEPLIVECDGHDFHERTKDQAANDKSRDRRLQVLGYHVFRFTGSEIFNNPVRCATDVFSYMVARRGTLKAPGDTNG